MISKFTLFRLSLVALLLLTIPTVFAQTYPVYLTETGTVKLGLQTPLKPSEKAVWVETTTGPGKNLTSAADGSYTIPAGATVGEHSYRVHLVSPDPANCDGDFVDYKVFVLPATTIALSDATLPLYCENGTVTTSTFTATATTPSSIPTEVTYSYAWSAKKDGTTVTDLTPLGSFTVAADTKSSSFVFKSTVVGTYEMTAQLNYIVPAGVTLRSGDNKGDIKTSPGKTVEVSAKPSQPVIVVM